MELSQEKLIIEQSKKEKRQFEPIYNAYFGDVFRYTLSILKDRDKAEETTQETFFQALKSLDRFKWQGTSVKYWLISIARHNVYNSKREKRVLFIETENEEMGKYEELIFNPDYTGIELSKDVEQAMAQLPQGTQEIILLKIWQDYKFNEIAELVGKGESFVKMQFYRGLEKIRVLLEKKGYKKNFVVLPIIFSCLYTVKDSADYQALPNNSFSDLFKFSKNNFMTIFTKPVVYGIVAVISVAAVIGGYSLVRSQLARDNSTSSQVSQVVEEQKSEDSGGKEAEQKDTEETSNGSQSNTQNDNQQPTTQTTTPPVSLKKYEFSFETTDYGASNHEYMLSFSSTVKDITEMKFVDEGGETGGVVFGNAAFKVSVAVPYEAYAVSYVGKDLKEVGNNSMFGKVSSVQLGSDKKVRNYVNSVTMTGTCTLMDTSLKSPCGVPVLDKDDANGTSLYVIKVACTASNFASCNEIAKALKIERVR